jgi:hypothetical protein
MAYQPQVSNLSRASGSTGSASPSKVEISTTAVQVYGWYIYNPGADVAYVQFFNSSSAGSTIGSPYYSIGIPGLAAANVFGPGIDHPSGLTIAVTTQRANAAGPTTAVDYNIFYK